MYIRRWLEAPIELKDGTLLNPQGKGTPQGGVISPLLSNLYLHYSVDKWMVINFPWIKMVRYADDIAGRIALERRRDKRRLCDSSSSAYR